jgi:phosphoribosylaminoimidazole (AIR) synthetase
MLDTGLADYRKAVRAVDDAAANAIVTRTDTTLDNCEYLSGIVKGRNALKVLRNLPEDHYVVVHSAAGDHHEDVQDHARSLVDLLVDQAEHIGATPLAFTNVIDWDGQDKRTATDIADALVQKANDYELAIINGEDAVLRGVINPEIKANVSGTMISIISKAQAEKLVDDNQNYFGPGVHMQNGTQYALFDHEGKAVSANSDGIGTKTLLHKMDRTYTNGLSDSLAMKVDDSAKSGARVMVVQDVVEAQEGVPLSDLDAEAARLGEELGIIYSLQQVLVGDRILGDSGGYNLSGTAVCLIDEDRLDNPLKASEGDYLIAIRGHPNPRSNGITAKRTAAKILAKRWAAEDESRNVADWSTSDEGKDMLEYLTAPCVILYPLFMDLIDEGYATSVFHMSGGAYESKLAAPLAKQGLFAKIESLFEPDPREIRLIEASDGNLTDAYSSYPMGNDGFITVSQANKDAALAMIESYGLEGKIVGQLEAKDSLGVELTAFDGSTVYFDGS